MLRSRQFLIVCFIGVFGSVLRIIIGTNFISNHNDDDDDVGYSPLLIVSTNSDDNNTRSNNNDDNRKNDQKKVEVAEEEVVEKEGDNNEYKHKYRWREWLLERQEQQQQNSNDKVITIHKVKPISLHTDWGCGFSMQVYFETPKIASSTIASTSSSTAHTTSSSASRTTEKTIKAFFKSSYADMTHYDAESHLREIKAYYLDQILKTYVVLPCVGYQFSSQQLQQQQQDNNNNDKKKATKKTLGIIYDNLDCTRENKEGNSNDHHQQQQEKTNSTTIIAADGSIMLWLDGIEDVDKEAIVKHARIFKTTSSNDSDNDVDGMTAGQLKKLKQHQKQISAINYAIFHYLGACMKSEHNHFRYISKNNHNKNKNKKKNENENEKNSNHHDQPSSLFFNNNDDDEQANGFGSSINNRYYTAIDNDRCMTPKSIYSNTTIVPELHFNRIELWKNLVFERICDYVSFNEELRYNHRHYQLPVLSVVQEAAVLASHNSGSSIRSNSRSLISNRLIEALKGDVLSYELIMSQPEAFTEIDDRINKLGKYIRDKCVPKM
jgi:hypothetical protein